MRFNILSCRIYHMILETRFAVMIPVWRYPNTVVAHAIMGWRNALVSMGVSAHSGNLPATNIAASVFLQRVICWIPLKYHPFKTVQTWDLRWFTYLFRCGSQIWDVASLEIPSMLGRFIITLKALNFKHPNGPSKVAMTYPSYVCLCQKNE